MGDEKIGGVALIDPTRDVGSYIQFAKDFDLHIQYIIETHVYGDFVFCSKELKSRLDDEPKIYSSSYGAKTGLSLTPITL